MLDAARHSLYVENQYLTAPGFAERLAANLRVRPELQAVLVTPAVYDGWLV